MKKIAAALSAWLMLSSLCMMQVSAEANENDFISAFFPAGTITAPPAAPYLSYTDTLPDDTQMCGQLNFFYDVTDDLNNFCNAVILEGEEMFSSHYGVEIINGVRIQIDAKIDEGAWLSKKGDWDKLDYGKKRNPINSNFKLNDCFWLDDTTKMHCFTQCYPAYLSEESEGLDFLEPCLVTAPDGNNILLDMANHTFTYRYRYFITYKINGYTGKYTTDDGNVLFSEWSPEASIGKNGTVSALSKPETVDAPVLSKYQFVENFDTGSFDVQYFMTIPRNIYEAQKYFIAMENNFDPYMIETQIRVNGGEWQSVYPESPSWLKGGWRMAGYYGEDLNADSKVEFRARLVCNALNGKASAWSNVIGTDIAAIAVDEPEIVPVATQPTPSDDMKPDAVRVSPLVWGGISAGVLVIVAAAFLMLRKKKSAQVQTSENESQKKS